MISVFDGHNDALTCADHADLAAGRKGGHLDLPRMRRGGIRGGIFAIFTPSPGAEATSGHGLGGMRRGAFRAPAAASVEQSAAAAHATAASGRLLQLERAGQLTIATAIADVDRARDGSSPPSAVLHLEGAEAIDPGLEGLYHWHAAGLRSLGPVWSRPNAFAHGVPFAFPSSPDIGPGLTDAGQALVRACAELGILVDLSHMNEAGFWDVARLEAGPLVASHSGIHALSAASRNLTDAQLDAIGNTAGLIGIVFATPFLRPDFANDTDTPIDLIAEHVRYAADRIGPEHVALGSDFDGATIPAEVGDAAGVPKVLAALERAGFTRAEIEAICWSNWRRVLDAWWR